MVAHLDGWMAVMMAVGMVALKVDVTAQTMVAVLVAAWADGLAASMVCC